MSTRTNPPPRKRKSNESPISVPVSPSSAVECYPGREVSFELQSIASLSRRRHGFDSRTGRQLQHKPRQRFCPHKYLALERVYKIVFVPFLQLTFHAGEFLRSPAIFFIYENLQNGMAVPMRPSSKSVAAEHQFLSTKWTGIHAQEVYFVQVTDRKSTRLNSSHTVISYAVFCLKKKKKKKRNEINDKE